MCLRFRRETWEDKKSLSCFSTDPVDRSAANEVVEGSRDGFDGPMAHDAVQPNLAWLRENSIKRM